MHDTAMANAKAFVDKYCQNLANGLVVDIGSQDINGTLKPLFYGHIYIGIDQAAGPNVDLVCNARDTGLPDNHADVVVSSSCFEHDMTFWLTFLEMARITKVGGLVYINAPSAGPFHQYPVDCWRFYGDAWKALAEWSKTNAYTTCGHLSLLESYIDRTCLWNNSVGIFQKEG